MSDLQLFQRVLKGNAGAIAFMQLLAKSSQVMDDLVDEDKPVTRQAKERLFWNLLVALPHNAFYRQHFERLNAMITHTLNDWFTANDLEQTHGEHNLRMAFILRDNLVQVLSECVLLIGGVEWLEAHRVAIRQYVHDELYEEYKRGLKP